MKTKNVFLFGLMIISLIVLCSFKSINKQDIANLNDILKKSLYKTSITIGDDGIVNRIDNNGNKFTYSLDDISQIKYDNDGFHNLIVVLKTGKKAKGIVEGKDVSGDINVISFSKKVDCDNAIIRFKKIIESQK